jgi:TetR/AcrR family transcriptional regulator
VSFDAASKLRKHLHHEFTNWKYDPTVPKRAGRPRRHGGPVTGDPTDEILHRAAALFDGQGVAATTMSQLAAEVGLGQSSLYYYFRSRDEVVAALVQRANVVPLDLVDAVSDASGSAGAKLLRFVRGDIEALCALPFDINEIHRIAARDRERFAEYWRERARLERRLSMLVRTGVDAGQLRPVDAPLVALTIMSNDEGVQNWFRLQTRRRAPAVARAVAELTVAGLLADSSLLTAVVQEAESLEV